MDNIEASIRDLATDVFHALEGISGAVSDKRGRYEECLELDPIYGVINSYVEKHLPGKFNKKRLDLTVLRSTLLEEDADPVFDVDRLHLYLRRSQFELLRETDSTELRHYFRSKAQALLIWRGKGASDEWMTITDAYLEDHSKSLLHLMLTITVFGPANFEWGPYECNVAARFVPSVRHRERCSDDTARKCAKCGARVACERHRELGVEMPDAKLCQNCFK